jgi:hypothetical protein
MRRSILFALGFAACGGEVDSEAPDLAVCDGDGAEHVLVSSGVRFARAVDGVSDGFDLDGETSVSGGLTGCGIADYTSPSGVPGIDNVMARMLPALEATEAQAVEALIHANVNDGNLLFVWKLTDVDDDWNDPCVGLDLYRGAGAPLVGNDGRLLPGQTFAINPDVPPIHVEASLVDGVLTASGLTIAVPIQVFQADLNLSLENAQVRFRRSDFEVVEVDRFGTTAMIPDGGYTGVFAGGVSTASLQAIADEENVDASLSSLVSGLLSLNADLAPQPDGTCAQVSVTFETYPIPAFLWEE